MAVPTIASATDLGRSLPPSISSFRTRLWRWSGFPREPCGLNFYHLGQSRYWSTSGTTKSRIFTQPRTQGHNFAVHCVSNNNNVNQMTVPEPIPWLTISVGACWLISGTSYRTPPGSWTASHTGRSFYQASICHDEQQLFYRLRHH